MNVVAVQASGGTPVMGLADDRGVFAVPLPCRNPLLPDRPHPARSPALVAMNLAGGIRVFWTSPAGRRRRIRLILWRCFLRAKRSAGKT